MPSEDPDAVGLHEPGEEMIIGLLRHALGMPLGWQPSPSMIADARAALRAGMRRRRTRRREGRDDMPSPRRTGALTGIDALVDFLCSPEGILVLDLLLAMPRAAAGFTAAMTPGAVMIGERVFRFRPWSRIEASRIVRYARDKLEAPARAPDVSPLIDEHQVAAVNCAAPARVSAWLAALRGGSDRDRRAALDEMSALGERAIVVAAPLCVWRSEPGPPRGILVDAAPVLGLVEADDAPAGGAPGVPRPPGGR